MSVDDVTGRRVGSQCGQGAWALARKYFDGSVLNMSLTLSIRQASPAQCELRFTTIRGCFYKLQSTPDLSQIFTDEPGGFSQAVDGLTTLTDGIAGAQKFYRVVGALAPY